MEIIKRGSEWEEINSTLIQKYCWQKTPNQTKHKNPLVMKMVTSGPKY